MKERKIDKLLDAMMPYVMFGLLGFLAALMVVAVASAVVENPERTWINDCAKHRPLADCQRDAKVLKVGE